MACSIVSIPLGNDPVFNEDDEITQLAVKTFAEFCHILYSNRGDGSKESFAGFCHDSYCGLVDSNIFPVVVDEDGHIWEVTTIYFNMVGSCYEHFFTALLSSMMEIHKTTVITGVHSVHLRYSPYRIADLIFNVRHLITGPELKVHEPYPHLTC